MGRAPSVGRRAEFKKHALTLGVLLVVGVALRIFVASIYEPLSYGDTGTYFRLAEYLATGDFSGFDGARTPGYPLFMLVAGRDPGSIWIAQQVLGVGASLLLYAVAWKLTHSVWLAVAVALAHALSLNSLFFEAALLTESLSGFLVLLATGLVVFVLGLEEPKPIHCIALGMTCAALGLTHPLFVFLGPFLFAVLFVRFGLKHAKRLCVPMLIAYLVPVGGWVGFNKIHIDYLGLTSFMGYNLSNHSGRFMELAPPGEIRDIFLRYRDAKVRATGTHSMTIFEAEDELRRKTGLSRPELSRQLAKMSVSLFLHHPMLYLRSVSEQWFSYWAVPNYWRPASIDSPQIRAGLQGVWAVEQWALRIANVAFLFSVFLLAWLSVKTAEESRRSMILTALVIGAIVIGASLVQALVEFGQTRYSVSTQPLVILVVGLTAYWLPQTLRGRRGHGCGAGS